MFIYHCFPLLECKVHCGDDFCLFHPLNVSPGPVNGATFNKWTNKWTSEWLNDCMNDAYSCWKWKSLSCIWLFLDPVTVVRSGPQSMEFLQARTPEWVAISFSRGSSRPKDGTLVSVLHEEFLPCEPPGSPMFMLLLFFNLKQCWSKYPYIHMLTQWSLYFIWTECFPKWKTSHNHEWVSFLQFHHSAICDWLLKIPSHLINLHFSDEFQPEHHLIYLLIIWICSSVNWLCANLPGW